jgi:5-methylcytosine-specific restriction endonuclease McrA
MTDLQERQAFTKGFRKGLATTRKDKELVDKVISREQEIYAELWKENAKCARCESTVKLTLDHIVPKSYLRDFGVNTDHEIIEGNYQLLCNLCNSYKSNKPDFTVPATKKILEGLLGAIK